MVPTFSGETSEMLKLENLCIASLQAPSQQGIGQAQAPRTHRPRKLPRFRKKPSIEDELNLNLMDELRRSPASRRKFDSQCFSFGSLCTFAMEHFKLLRVQVLLHMYSYRYVYWLALYLAGKGAKLSYRTVWRIPNPVEFCARLWGACQKLPKHTKHVAVSKVLRFFALWTTTSLSCTHDWSTSSHSETLLCHEKVCPSFPGRGSEVEFPGNSTFGRIVYPHPKSASAESFLALCRPKESMPAPHNRDPGYVIRIRKGEFPAQGRCRLAALPLVCTSS